MTPERMRQLKKLADRGIEMEIPIASDLRECLAEIAALEERNRALERMLPDVGYAAALHRRIVELEQKVVEQAADIRGYFIIRDKSNHRITELESTVQAQADTLAKLREALMKIADRDRWRDGFSSAMGIAEAALEATK